MATARHILLAALACVAFCLLPIGWPWKLLPGSFALCRTDPDSCLRWLRLRASRLRDVPTKPRGQSMINLTDQDLVILAILATPGIHLSHLARDWCESISRLRAAGLVVTFPDDSAYATPKGAHVVREMTTIGLVLGSPRRPANVQVVLNSSTPAPISVPISVSVPDQSAGEMSK